MFSNVEERADSDKKRIVVAMSGGVDSSVVAALLVEQGYEVVGITMRLYEAKKATRGCCSPDDLYDARSVAGELDIPFYVVNYQEEFRTTVIDPFISEYSRGRTPSPCILCNHAVKFDTLLQLSLKLGGSYLATGHYARIETEPDGHPRLLRGLDPVKDQSYFLFGIPSETLSQLMFPLGDQTKDAVRRLAARFGLPTAEKEESQDLCFAEGYYLDFLEDVLPQKSRRPGDLINVETGATLGKHDGIHRFTIGQRRGIGVGGAGGPLYVCGISETTGSVLVGPKEALETTECTLSRCNWLRKMNGSFKAAVQIRYRHRPVPATIEAVADDSVRVVFDEPESAVTPGQAAVFYLKDEVLGGGWIDSKQ